MSLLLSQVRVDRQQQLPRKQQRLVPRQRRRRQRLEQLQQPQQRQAQERPQPV